MLESPRGKGVSPAYSLRCQVSRANSRIPVPWGRQPRAGSKGLGATNTQPDSVRRRPRHGLALDRPNGRLATSRALRHRGFRGRGQTGHSAHVAAITGNPGPLILPEVVPAQAIRADPRQPADRSLRIPVVAVACNGDATAKPRRLDSQHIVQRKSPSPAEQEAPLHPRRSGGKQTTADRSILRCASDSWDRHYPRGRHRGISRTVATLHRRAIAARGLTVIRHRIGPPRHRRGLAVLLLHHCGDSKHKEAKAGSKSRCGSQTHFLL